MPITGVFFIPANPKLVHCCYYRRWGLEHKLLRDTPSCLPPSAYAPLPQLQPRYMHFLSLSHFQSHGFVYISNRPSPDPWGSPGPHHTHPGIPAPSAQQQVPAPQPQPINEKDGQQPSRFPPSSPWTMITPDPASFNSFFAMTLRACEPLWCHRHTTIVSGGTVFEVGDFRVRVGDVRQAQPAQRVRGCIVEIEYRGPGQTSISADGDWRLSAFESGTEEPLAMGDGFSELSNTMVDGEEDLPTEEDWDVGEKLIREFWSGFAVPGAREAIRVPGLMTEVNKARHKGMKRVTTADAGPSNTGIKGADLARQYMELLRFNR
ncbi:predicted protein [Uncinocarpus reesii 1704]|uniref:Mediator of RNA polymerase II transcription subunit 20 n=1 Tax=Uncinocarpus reesii (strain UAMH 1704) TaxID=336963 RepID=C4JQ64_UNCRE|nr:uncharacterized protein UREG_03297 [Uncinocarpus reesii 1704]EEP78451.1 predicted protein [Uncinocarpus reesii 1704]